MIRADGRGGLGGGRAGGVPGVGASGSVKGEPVVGELSEALTPRRSGHSLRAAGSGASGGVSGRDRADVGVAGSGFGVANGRVMDDDTKLPMPEDETPGGGASVEGGASGGGEAPLPMPEDTAFALTGGSSAGGSGSGGRAGLSRTGSLSGGESVSMDSVVGRMVVEQGLATNEEVVAASRRHRERSEDSESSLGTYLVEAGAITSAQFDRLKSQLEAERSGGQIPGFKVMAKVGAGAMAAVFKARQISLDRLVAIKVLPRKFNGNRQFIERFYAEGRAAAQLNHPNIVQAYDVGRAGEFHYFVMEYVEGGTVHDQIVQNKRFGESEALDIIINIADALKHAHEKGLVHRDVKPKNIMMTLAGVAKLADLGLARAIDDKDAALAEKGKAYGTPYYISPEQIRGEVNVGPQADIYSLGATVYHMVTGNVPFDGKSPREVMEKHLREELVPPDHVNARLSSRISEVVEMMMAKSRRQRYKTMGDVLVDLRAVKRGEDPPIAHKEATTEILAEVVAAQASLDIGVEGGYPEDRSRVQSAWADPGVKLLIALCVLMFLWGAVATALWASGG